MNNPAITAKELKSIVFGEIAKVGKAISEPKRLEIIELLGQSERNVDDLASMLSLDKAITSHHLQVLKTNKLVTSRKQGRFSFYKTTKLANHVWHIFSDLSHEISGDITCAMNEFFDPEMEVDNLDRKELINRIKKNEVILLDIRPYKEYQAGHFPGAISVPLKELEQKIRLFPKSRKIIAYCRGPYCVLSEMAVVKLREKKRRAYRWKESIVDWPELVTGEI